MLVEPCCSKYRKILEMTDRGFNRGYMRRIQREMKFLEDGFDYVESSHDDETKSHIIRCLVDNWILEAYVPQMYPFKAPTVYINHRNYRDMLIFRDHKYREILKANGIDCLCCHSILCTSNWAPIKMIHNVFDEVLQNKKLIQSIIYTLLVREICKSKGITCPEIPEMIMGQMFDGKLPIVPYDSTE